MTRLTRSYSVSQFRHRLQPSDRATLLDRCFAVILLRPAATISSPPPPAVLVPESTFTSPPPEAAKASPAAAAPTSLSAVVESAAGAPDASNLRTDSIASAVSLASRSAADVVKDNGAAPALPGKGPDGPTCKDMTALVLLVLLGQSEKE